MISSVSSETLVQSRAKRLPSSVSSEALTFIGLEQDFGFISFVVSSETLVSLVSSETDRHETVSVLFLSLNQRSLYGSGEVEKSS
ncbi:hypothetical protein F2Q69_00030783 [Brassica cretica]|uniref:Uncharacterized protein n=1 Tax=Brassica cretica TaxID=69181 RepID=A0A8S9S6X1_BRACR|nr:hypothetical protein F2Q69_00030783 [Brassica cretica]